MSDRTRYLLAAVLVCSALMLGVVAPVKADLSGVIAVGSNSNQVNLFDLSQPTVTATTVPQPIPTFVNPADVAICSDGSKAVTGQTLTVNRVLTGYLFVFDPAEPSQTATTVNLGSYSPQQITIDLTGSRAATGNNNGNAIKIVDLNTLNVLQAVTLVHKDKAVSTLDRPRAVGYTRDGRLVVGVYGPVVGNYVNVFMEAADGLIDGTPLKTINIPASPSMLAIAPNNRYAVISSLDGDSVTVIDLDNYEPVVVPNVNDPGEPDVTADGHFALVPNTGTNLVTVIDLGTAEVVRTIPVATASWTIGAARGIAVINGNEALVAGSGGVARIVGLKDLTESSPVEVEQVSSGAINHVAVAPWPEFIPDGSGLNQPPVFDVVDDQTVFENDLLEFTVSAADPEGEGLTYSANDLPYGATLDSLTGAFTWTPDFEQAGRYTVIFTASDGEKTVTVPVEITVEDFNRPPVLEPIGDKSLREGESIAFSVIASDPDGSDVSFGVTGMPTEATFDTGTGRFSLTDAAQGISTITFSVTDGTETVYEEITITVIDGRAPIITNSLTDPNPVAVGIPVTITALVDDTNMGGSIVESASCSIDGGAPLSMTARDGTFDGSTESVLRTLTGLTTGVHRVTLQAADAEGNVATISEPLLIIVYDPSAGFVTGGGWINSPVDPASPYQAATGKATFGFVAKYQKGMTAPKGETEFTFKTGGMTFHSESYNWLLVTQTPGGLPTAELQGTGILNGVGGYVMTLTTVDNGRADTLRFRIADSMNKVVYDTGDAMIPLEGGSIVIHSK